MKGKKMNKYLYLKKSDEKNIKTTNSFSEILKSVEPEKETYVLVVNEKNNTYKYFCTIKGVKNDILN